MCASTVWGGVVFFIVQTIAVWAGWMSSAAYPVPSLVEKVVGDGGMFVCEKIGAGCGGWLDVVLSALSNTSVECGADICFSLGILVILCVAGNSGMLIDVLPGLVQAFLGYYFVSVRTSELREVSASSACGGSGNSVNGSVVASEGSGAGCEFEGHVGGVRCVLDRADVMLCAFPFACTLITAVLQGPSVCGNEVGNK